MAPDDDTQKRLRFIDELQLAAPEQADVVGGQLMSFVEGLDLQNQQDVMNSCLLAQLAANKQFNKETQTEDWYKYYANVLETVGWVVRTFSFDKVDNAEQSGTVDALVIDIMSNVLSGKDLDLLKRAIEALKNSDNGLRIFNSLAKSGQQASFSLGVCNQASNGNVLFQIGYYYYSTNVDITNVLFFKFVDTTVNFSQGNQEMELNTEVYGTVREQVLEKLGKNASEFIDNLEI
ncbi:hypothetical protein VNI00_016628 [Paramarasmius palmivorus]|uniref:Uncharacterized protein n=1 Tax=Paramarasmius palmivorus TaxID=297713 RepID=A0AAW0BB51_9AGAR